MNNDALLYNCINNNVHCRNSVQNIMSSSAAR